MSAIDRLYQDMILEHNKNPRGFKELPEATHKCHGVNPLCGDDFWVYVKVENDSIQDIAFHGNGCAISKSSGSLMASYLKGKQVQDAVAVKEAFLNMLVKDAKPDEVRLGKLTVLEGVKKFPVRVKCATLVWRALEGALEGTEPITTES